MEKKYIPRIGDVIICDDIPYVVMDMKIYNEGYHPGGSYYNRDYYLLKEKILNEYLDKWSDSLFPCEVPLYKKITFIGFESELSDIKKVDEILYEVKTVHGFRVIKKEQEKEKIGIIEY